MLNTAYLLEKCKSKLQGRGIPWWSSWLGLQISTAVGTNLIPDRELRSCKKKNTMRYHLTPVRMAILKSLQITNSGEGVEKKKEPSYTVSETVSW